jgi:hypothetical protein
MTVHQKAAFRTAGIFLGSWLLLALAIADLPPPPGFVIVVLITETVNLDRHISARTDR